MPGTPRSRGAIAPTGTGIAPASSRAAPITQEPLSTPVPPATDRLEPSIAATVWAATKGVGMVRVHDVAATVSAVRIVCDPVAVN